MKFVFRCTTILAFFALICTPILPSAQALKPGEVSPSAEIAAALRAVASMDPDPKVRNPDYLARKFVKPELWFFAPLSEDYRKSRAMIEQFRMNYYFSANAHTWHIDGILHAFAKKGLQQVVHIGAGFDTRPYRFGKRMPGVRFFEVDQPATQALKKQMVEAALGELPTNVTYVAIDYRTRPFIDALLNAGYREGEKTLFIWEGSTSFTSKDVVDQNLSAMAVRSGSGSELVFDYIPGEIVDGDYSQFRGAMFAAIRLDASGEPWVFGIPTGKADDYVGRYGFRVISDLNNTQLAERYLTRSNGTIDGVPPPIVRIMHAVVDR
jgi:methyltransferase (TIGR00027 family)